VRVRFEGARKQRGPAGAPDAYELVYRKALLNYDMGRSWRRRPDAPRKAAAGDSFASSANWIKITIEKRGLYAITYSDLVDAGVLNPRAAVGDPRTLRLYSGPGRALPESEAAPRPDWMKQLAIRVVGEEDGSFDPTDRIEFFALPVSGWAGEFDPEAPEYYEHVDHPYAWQNAFWLTWGGTFEEAAKRMGTREAGPAVVPGDAVTLATFPERVHAEENIVRDLSRYGEDGWFWDKFSPTENDKSFYLRAFDADTSADGTARVRLFHYVDNLNNCGIERARIQVNGVPSLLQEWNSCVLVDGAIAPYDFDSTAHWVADGWNRFDIQVAFRQKVYLSWLELGYRRFLRARDGSLHFRLEEPGSFRVPVAGLPLGESRVFEVTDPFGVAELTGLSASGDSLVLHVSVSGPVTFHALVGSAWSEPVSIEKVTPANLRDASNAAEYLVICYDDFAAALAPLVAYRAERYSTRLIHYSDVVNEFGWGVRDAVAVRDFLAYAYHNWPAEKRPVFALLVGDATSDFKGYLQSALVTLIPTYFRVDKGGSETNTYATDDFFSYLDPVAGDVDRIPDISVGRFPVNSIDEARVVAEKTVRYETDPEFGPWRNRLLFLADDEIKRGNASGFDCGFLLAHTEDTESVSDACPEYFDKVKVYLVEYPITSSGLKPLAKSAYVDWIGKGFLYSNYLGHGGFDKMADEELLLLTDVDASLLSNGRRLHLFGAYSCSIGSFDLLELNSLAEAFLKTEGGGSIASFASDAPAFAGVSLDLDTAFVSNLFGEGHGKVPLGLAAQAAKSARGAGIGREINDEKYTILGDPALRLGLPELEVRFGEGEPVRFRRGIVDTLVAEVVDSVGARVTSFDGTAEVSIWGMADTLGYSFLDTACYGTPTFPRLKKVSYGLDGPTFFQGTVDVRDGVIRAPFFVPRDTRVGTLGRASAYAYDPSSARDGSGGDDSVSIVAEPPGTVWSDSAGPGVRFTVNGIEVRDGTSFTRNSVFRVELEDESGINLQGNDNFYTVHLVFDRGKPIDLTSLFRYDVNSYRRGALSFRLSDFSDVFVQEGPHELAFRAADNLNNRTERDYQIFVVSEGEELAFRSPVLNYPNPFDPDSDGSTEFSVDLTKSARVTLQILTHTGKRIFETTLSTSETGLSVRYDWDGRDGDGDLVGNGVYLVRIVAESQDGSEKTETVGKAVVLRGVR
jgi:hypothetical protein